MRLPQVFLQQVRGAEDPSQSDRHENRQFPPLAPEKTKHESFPREKKPMLIGEVVADPLAAATGLPPLVATGNGRE
jgi:hypothetical protein